MPHIIIEHTKGCNLKKDELNRLLQDLNIALGKVESFPIEAIKSRAFKVKNYIKADGKNSNEYLHINCTVMEGRSEAILKIALDTLVNTTKPYLEKEEKSIPITCEIREMKSHLYFK